PRGARAPRAAAGRSGGSSTTGAAPGAGGGAPPRRPGRPSRLLLLARPEGPSQAQLEAHVAVEANAVDLLADAVDHRLAEREVVELEDQVPGPRTGHDGTD